MSLYYKRLSVTLRLYNTIIIDKQGLVIYTMEGNVEFPANLCNNVRQWTTKG